ncbi:MAG: ketopantoate reductase family protein [Eubacteriaceae bacterium]|nr:ketopantoate reductase family protein [Eubacteriaceae bacterium]
MKKIAVVGAGAMGCVIGAYLKKGGADVTLIDPFKEHMDNIANNGLILNSSSSREVVKMNTALSAQDADIMDIVIIMVKGTLTDAALKGAQSIIGKDTYVCTFQNGIGNVDIIQKTIPKEKILYGCLNMASILKAPGEVYGNLFDEVNVYIGSIIKEEEQIKTGNDLARTFTDGGAVSKYVDDIDTHVWSKAMVNLVANATCGLVRLNGQQAAKNTHFLLIATDIVKEALAIAEAKGVKGLDFATFMTKTIPAARATAGDHYPSMAQDMMITKKKTEIEFLNGAFERMGKELNIPTPVNTTIARLVRTVESNYENQYFNPVSANQNA